jgi:hypothetical protein
VYNIKSHGGSGVMWNELVWLRVEVSGMVYSGIPQKAGNQEGTCYINHSYNRYYRYCNIVQNIMPSNVVEI